MTTTTNQPRHEWKSETLRVARAAAESRHLGTPPNVTPRLRGVLSPKALARCAGLVALGPPLLMLREIMRAPRLQYIDYWHVLVEITAPDGSLLWGNLGRPFNDHPILLDGLAYWLHAEWFGADNRLLAGMALGASLVALALLAWKLPVDLPTLVQAGLLVAASALLFSPHGIQTFLYGMMGVQWLVAEVFAIAAIITALRRRWILSYLSGLLAFGFFGSGLAVWPALAVVGLMRREPVWRRLTPLGIGACVAGLAALAGSTTNPGGVPSDNVDTFFYLFFSLAGHLWTGVDSGVAALVGGAVIGGYALLATMPAARVRSLYFWWALGAYGVAMCAMTAVGRLDWGVSTGLSSRYTPMSVMASLPLIVIGASLLHRSVNWDTYKIALMVGGIGVLGYTLGAARSGEMRETGERDHLKAIAIRTGFSETYGEAFPPAAELVPRMKAMQLYPFSETFSLGCDGPELGSPLEMAAVGEVPVEGSKSTGFMGEVETVANQADASTVKGWAMAPGDQVRCVVLVGPDGSVVGGGISHLSRQHVHQVFPELPLEVGFEVIGPSNPGNRVVVILKSGAMWSMPAG